MVAVRGHRSGSLCRDAQERVDLGGVDLREGIDLHVSVLALPVVILFEEHGADQADDGLNRAGFAGGSEP